MTSGEPEVRWRLDVAYDGTAFSGWAAQPGLRTVQGTLEDALRRVLRLPAAVLTVAGRTDAGVHARGQVCHVDVPAAAAEGADLDRLSARLARLLPEDVRVQQVAIAPAGFDARFSAAWRRYAYRICDAPARADPLQRTFVLAWPRRLDGEQMARAAAPQRGEQDFAAFCKRREGASTVRALRRWDWTRRGPLLVADVVADAFCHTMVRSLVGCLVAVGEGRRGVSWPAEVLARRRRDPAVAVVPAKGLTLEEVGYPADALLAERVSLARAVRAAP